MTHCTKGDFHGPRPRILEGHIDHSGRNWHHAHHDLCISSQRKWSLITNPMNTSTRPDEEGSTRPKELEPCFSLVQVGYQNSIQASLGRCPFKLLHGRDPVLPISLKDFAPELNINEKADLSLNDTAEHLASKTLEELYKDALNLP